MAFNPDRFVVIDGVQISKTRALREGLIDDKGRIVRSTEPVAAEPGSTRARTSGSTRKGSGGKTKATGGEAPADQGDDAAADAGSDDDPDGGDQES